jgi:hypothetical protein
VFASISAGNMSILIFINFWKSSKLMTVNQRVVGSSPTRGALRVAIIAAFCFMYSIYILHSLATDNIMLSLLISGKAFI